MGGKRLYRKYDEETGELKELECGICHEIKTNDCFCKDKSKKDGVQTKCKQCLNEINRQWYENNKEEKYEYNHRYLENHKEEICEYYRQRYENHKEEIREYDNKYRENKTKQEITKIYENVTKQRYPRNGVQYGAIYGVACKVTNRWYIGQTTKSFNIRYNGNFFNCKTNELYDDSEKKQLLNDDIEKYGQENFEIIEVLDVAFSEKELDEKEAYYIDLYKAYDEGYNSNRGNIFKHGKAKKKCCYE